MIDPGVVAVLVAAISGGLVTKSLEAAISAAGRRSRERRTEVDRMARALRDEQRRAHMLLLWGRALEVLAVEFGVPPERMPVLDYKDRPRATERG